VGPRRYVIERARLFNGNVQGLPPGLAVVDNAILGVCGDGRALAIHSLLADGLRISPAELRTQLAEGHA
jgi:methionyl-tRNA formyltransferase